MPTDHEARALTAADARAAVSNLVMTYAELLDLGDLEGVGELFADGEIISRPDAPVRRGRDDVVAMYRAAVRLYPDGTPRTKHVTTNLVIDVALDGDGPPTATCRSYFTVLQAVDERLPLQAVIAGRYHDEFEQVEGRWCFRRRRMFGDLYGELSHHMLFDLPRPSR
ncbi:MAG: nuclear transport factor 2 family protein [Actinobacteria bacterium]|nr:nuclear transport factor 2 family protein [Actinomycetota bacterium]